MANALDPHAALSTATAKTEELETAPNRVFDAEKADYILSAIELEGIEDPKAWGSGKKCKWSLSRISRPRAQRTD